jgi:hypothetical protein
VQRLSRQKVNAERRNLQRRARHRHSRRHHKADEEASPRQHRQMLGLVVRNSLSVDRNTICNIVRWSKSTVLHLWAARGRRLDHRGSDTQLRRLERCRSRCRRCRDQYHQQLPQVRYRRSSLLSLLRARAARIRLRHLQGQACAMSHHRPQYRHHPHYLSPKRRQCPRQHRTQHHRTYLHQQHTKYHLPLWKRRRRGSPGARYPLMQRRSLWGKCKVGRVKHRARVPWCRAAPDGLACLIVLWRDTAKRRMYRWLCGSSSSNHC